VSVLDPATGKVEELEAPKFESPEAKAFWEPVCREVRARLEKRGLLSAMMAGISAENRFPTKEAVATFQELLPGARWVFNGHPASGGAVHGMPVGYETRVYIGFPPPAAWDAKRKFAWQNPSRFDIFPRSGPSIGPLYPQRPLAQHHAYPEMALLSSSYGVNYNGLGRTGADFWAVLGSAGRPTGKRSATITGRYPESCWNQLNMNCATEALLAPGPGGATTTERFENLREGVQECEARICLEKAIVGGRLDAALARKCQEVLDERARRFRTACAAEAWTWYAGSGSAGLAEELFSAAAEAARERR
jgi:hypothetical protein